MECITKRELCNFEEGNMRTQFSCLGLSFILVLALMTFNTPNIILERLPTTGIRPSSANVESYYSPHDPIVISYNVDFKAQGWPGNGSESNPYLIQYLSFASDGICISISTTDVHFRINNCSFSHDTKRGGSRGVLLQTVQNGAVENCVFVGLFRCIEANSVSNVLFENNSFYDEFYGMQLAKSVDCVVTNNVFERVGLWLWGTEENHFLSNFIVNNTVEGKPIAVLMNRLSEAIDASSYGQLFLLNSSKCIIENGTFDYRNVGVSLALCSDSVIRNIKSTYTSVCLVELQLCINIDVMRCDIAGSYNQGFRFFYTTDCSLTDCKAGYSVDDWCTGINIFYNENTTIARNVFQVTGAVGAENDECLIVDNNVEGRSNVLAPSFTFADSHNFTMDGNELHGVGTGIAFAHGSTNGTIVNNRIHDNHGYGVRLYAECQGFRIYNNSFWNNEEGNALDDGFSNSWDDGISLGNRWDDYNGVGFYSISGSAESVDNFPGTYSHDIPTTATTLTNTTSTTSTQLQPVTVDGLLVIGVSGAIVVVAAIIFVKARRR